MNEWVSQSLNYLEDYYFEDEIRQTVPALFHSSNFQTLYLGVGCVRIPRELRCRCQELPYEDSESLSPAAQDSVCSKFPQELLSLA